MRLRTVGVIRLMAMVLAAFAVCAAACNPSPGLHRFRDGEGPLLFSPDGSARLELERAPQQALLWGGFRLANRGPGRVVLEDISITARGDCRPIPEPYRDTSGVHVGIEFGSPSDFELAPLFSGRNARLGLTETMIVVFAVDGGDCGVASSTSYGPIEVFYRNGDKHAVTTYDYYFDVGW